MTQSTAVPKKAATFRRYGEAEDRPRKIRAQITSILAIASGVVYFVLLPGSLNQDAPVVSAAFVVAELSCLFLLILATTNVWTLRFKPPEGLPAEYPSTIDVLITVCDEPMPVVERSLRTAAELRWDGPLTVYVLDDGGRAEVEQRARELGFEYLSRPKAGLPLRDRKAGNLNYGLDRSSAEFVLTLDADHEIQRDALRPMAGYMKFPRVAFVQSKQRFIVGQDDPFNAQDPVFYDGVQLAFDQSDTVISCGSGVLYRRAALEDIGGFASWNLVEDLTTSYELHSRGWKTLYYPFSVTKGLAPANIQEVYQQRGQWAVDTMRLFFWDNPLLKKGLNWRQRLDHLMIGLSYIWSGFLIPIFFLIPIWTYLTGRPLIVENEALIVVTRLVYFVLFALAGRYLFRGRSFGKQFQFLAGLFPVYVLGTLTALFHPRGRKPSYRTSNGERRPSRPLWIVLAPQILVFGANAVLPFWALFNDVATPWVLLANIFVSSFVLWTLWPVIVAGLTHRTDSLQLAGLAPDGS